MGTGGGGGGGALLDFQVVLNMTDSCKKYICCSETHNKLKQWVLKSAQYQVLVKSVNSDCLKSANWLSATLINRLQIGTNKTGQKSR